MRLIQSLNQIGKDEDPAFWFILSIIIDLILWEIYERYFREK